MENSHARGLAWLAIIMGVDILIGLSFYTLSFHALITGMIGSLLYTAK